VTRSSIVLSSQVDEAAVVMMFEVEGIMEFGDGNQNNRLHRIQRSREDQLFSPFLFSPYPEFREFGMSVINANDNPTFQN
jgi:hypothetical protein